ncbi:MAG TPA: hypothetical protein VFU38_02485, partial [Candidatus Krumholzibacteria bacterium]|nr:hypothetical protein [Candidatus Krumholzibacteria bacterium]
MGNNLVVAIYIISVALLAALSAALTSLGVLSLRRAEQDDETVDWLHRRAAEDPVHTGVALGIARSTAMLAVVVSAVALVHAAGPVGAGVFAAASLLLPTFAARALALEGAGSLLRVVRPIVIPVVYLVRPVAILGSKLLGR